MTNHSKHPLYEVWRTIRKRCGQSPQGRNYKDYARYGGRGIRMCREWAESYEAFYEWAMTHGWKPGLTVDRVCNNRGYSPYNCRFVSRRAQANNRSTNTRVRANGEEHTIAQWSRITGIKETAILQRIKRGMDPARAVTLPAREYHYHDKDEDEE